MQLLTLYIADGMFGLLDANLKKRLAAQVMRLSNESRRVKNRAQKVLQKYPEIQEMIEDVKV